MAITRTLYTPDGRSLVLSASQYAVQRAEIDGTPPIRSESRALPLDDGAFMEDQYAEPRTITIVAKMLAETHDGLLGRSAALNSMLRINRRRQRTEYWRYRETSYQGDAAELRCFPVGQVREGPQGFTQIVGVQMLATDPFWYATDEEEVDISFTQTLTTRHIVAKVNGEWTALGPPAAGVSFTDITDIVVDPNTGRVYVCGQFTSWDNQAGLDYLVYWDPSDETWNTLGAPSASPEQMLIGPDGTLHIVGNFSNFGGVASADVYAYWTGSAWSGLASSPSLVMTAIAIDPDTGYIYVGGGTNGVEYWDGSSWTSAGTCPLDNYVSALVFGNDGTLYAVGAISSGGGTTKTGTMASWDGSSWTTISTADDVGTQFNDAVFTENGTLLVGGIFGDIDGVDVGDNIFAWNGYTESGLDGGLISAATGAVYSISIDDDATVYVVGSFGEASGIDLADGYARWNGYTWAHVPLGYTIPITVDELPIVVAHEGDLYFALDTSGDLTAAAATTVSNRGSADVNPVFVVEGPATLQSIANATSGQEMLFNLYVNEGETVTIDTRPGRRSVVSDWRGRLEALPGGDDDGFVLRPGDNLITAYAEDTDSDTAITCKFTPKSHSFEEAVQNLVYGVARSDTAAVWGPAWDVFSRGGTYYARSRIAPNDREATVAGGWREEDDAAGLTLIRAATNYARNPRMYDGDDSGVADSPWVNSGGTLSGTGTTSIVSHPIAERGWMQRLEYTGVAGDSSELSTFHINTASGSFSAGDPCTFAVDIDGSTDVDVLLQIRAYDASNVLLGNEESILSLSSDLDRYEVTYPSLPATTDYVQARVYWAYNVDEGDVVDIRFGAAMITKVPYSLPHFDGYTAGAAWASTVHNSNSSIATGGSCNLTNPLRSPGAVGVWWAPVADQDGPTRYLFDEGNLAGYFNAADNKFYLTDGTNTISTAAQTFSADEEIFLAFVWASSRLEIYVDGTSAASGTSFTAPTAGATLYIGTDSSSANQNDGAIRQWFAALKALSDDEVADIYAEGVIA